MTLPPELFGLGAVGLIAAIIGMLLGHARGKATGRKEGVEIATNTISRQTAEHTLEKVNEANDAGAFVERRTDAGVRDAARTDPNNLGRVRRAEADPLPPGSRKPAGQ